MARPWRILRYVWPPGQLSGDRGEPAFSEPSHASLNQCPSQFIRHGHLAGYGAGPRRRGDACRRDAVGHAPACEGVIQRSTRARVITSGRKKFATDGLVLLMR